MERKEQIQYDWCGVPRDFTQLKRLVSKKHSVEHPTARWIREYERTPTDEEQGSLRYLEYKEIYEKETDFFTKLEKIADSILYMEELPQYTDEELKSLYTRFPSLVSYLEGHIDAGSPSVDVYMNALMSYIPEKNYHELDYVIRSAQNGIEVPIPFNEQFRACRYVPYEVVVSPYPEGHVFVDSRTLINKIPIEVPELVVDAISVQASVDLEKPIAVVFEVTDNDPELGQSLKSRVRWDEKGTTFTDQPVGLYSGLDRVVFNNSIGVIRGQDYLMLQNGVIRYATEKCYITVVCDGKKIRTRDQYVLGNTSRIGVWRYEVMTKRLVCRTGGQPEFYEEVKKKKLASCRYQVEQDYLRSYPVPMSVVNWVISLQSCTVYLGRLVKKNKILKKLKEGGIVRTDEYVIIFNRMFPKCVYYGDRRLLIGEHGKHRKNVEAEFKRFPYHYDFFRKVITGIDTK